MRIRRRAGSTECGCAQPRGWSGRGAAVLFRFARFSARPLRMTCRVPGGRTVVGAGYPAGCFDVAGPCLSGEGARRHLPTGFRTKWRHPIPRFDSAFRFRVSILRSDSAFDSASVSAFRFRVPIPRSDSAFRFCVSIPCSDSAFRFRVPIPRSDSAFRFRIPIPRSDSAFCICFRVTLSHLHSGYGDSVRCTPVRVPGALPAKRRADSFGTRTFVDEHFRIYGRINRRGRPVFPFLSEGFLFGEFPVGVLPREPVRMRKRRGLMRFQRFEN